MDSAACATRTAGWCRRALSAHSRSRYARRTRATRRSPVPAVWSDTSRGRRILSVTIRVAPRAVDHGQGLYLLERVSTFPFTLWMAVAVVALMCDARPVRTQQRVDRP